MKNAFKQLAEKILFTTASSEICGEFNDEKMYRLRDRISNGLEIEDPENEYTVEDKITSAAVFLEEALSKKEAIKLLNS